MGNVYAQTMFTEEVKKLQEDHASRRQYEKLALRGERHEALTAAEVDFIGRRDSFYIATVSSDGWPYVQHRGGPIGFLRVVDSKRLMFADYAGNKQYISAGNLATNSRVSLFLMDYPNQARLKVIGHAQISEPPESPGDSDPITAVSYRATIERVFTIDVLAYDWNCSQHITPRYSRAEMHDFPA